MRPLAFLAAPFFLAAPALAVPASPQAVVDELLAAERAFSAAAASRDPVEGISAMFADDVTLPTPAGHVTGRAAAIAAMRANPGYRAAYASWRAIRAGVSADGTHGFTFGYMDMEGAADPERARRRYLAYWVRGAQGWRVAILRQVLRGVQEAERAPMADAVPARMIRPTGARHAAEVQAAERAFSDRAQVVGLRAAFAEYGRADAMNMGSAEGFLIGAEEISTTLFDTSPTSPLRWSADRALAASSGDMGVTIGTIVSNDPQPGARPFPFFTVWMREAGGEWRYVAE